MVASNGGVWSSADYAAVRIKQLVAGIRRRRQHPKLDHKNAPPDNDPSFGKRGQQLNEKVKANSGCGRAQTHAEDVQRIGMTSRVEFDAALTGIDCHTCKVRG